MIIEGIHSARFWLGSVIGSELDAESGSETVNYIRDRNGGSCRPVWGARVLEILKHVPFDASPTRRVMSATNLLSIRTEIWGNRQARKHAHSRYNLQQ